MARRIGIILLLGLLATSALLVSGVGVSAGTAAVCSVVLAGLVYGVVRRSLRPLGDLSKAMAQLTAGDLTARSPCRGTDELADLARAFNAMAGALQAREEALRCANETLEAKVQERTAAFNRLNEALQTEVQERRRADEALQEAHRRLATLAITDDLTGLWNRRRFMEALGQEFPRSQRRRSPLALAMIDVDRFKVINDTRGNAFGDQALKRVAQVLRQEARETDFVARYGGEEFMVLMPDTTAEQARVAAERIRRRMAEQPVADDRQSVSVTVSAGVADVSEAGTPEALLRLAEEALHAAEHAGRNCTRTMSQIVRDSQEAAAIDREAVSSLQRQVDRLSCESREMLVQSVQSLVRAVEARDPYTKHHSENVTQYAVAIAQTLGLGEEATAPIRRAAMIHDVGKIGVPDAILSKRGPLPSDERRVMEQHVLVGVCILEQLRFLDREVPMVRHHHERWGGQGYPDGIAGQGIPLGARILAVADAFDAITSDRPYRQARPVAEALKILQEEAGRQFDPGVVDALVQWVRDISQADGDPGDLMAADLLKPRAAAPA